MDKQAEDDARLGFRVLAMAGAIPPALPAEEGDVLRPSNDGQWLIGETTTRQPVLIRKAAVTAVRDGSDRRYVKTSDGETYGFDDSLSDVAAVLGIDRDRD